LIALITDPKAAKAKLLEIVEERAISKRADEARAAELDQREAKIAARHWSRKLPTFRYFTGPGLGTICPKISNRARRMKRGRRSVRHRNRQRLAVHRRRSAGQDKAS
jgi:hypothetical protein